MTLPHGVALGSARAQYEAAANPGAVLDVTLSLDTNAYADGDVLADVQEVANAFSRAGARRVLNSVLVLDEDDQGVAFDLVFFNASATLGTENAAVGLSDADARKIVAVVSVGSGDYVDLVNSKVAQIENIGVLIEAESTSLYVGAVSRGIGTYSASGIRLKLGLL